MLMLLVKFGREGAGCPVGTPVRLKAVHPPQRLPGRLARPSESGLRPQRGEALRRRLPYIQYTILSPPLQYPCGKFLQGFADRCQTGAFVVYLWL